MAVVIADRIGGAEIRDPSGFEQRNQPSLMLPGDGDGARNRESEGAAATDGGVENRVNPPQKRAAERRKAVREDFVEGVAFVDTSNLHRAMFVS